MKEIDMTLFPTESEIIEATKNTTLTWIKTVTVAVSAARKDTVERFPQTWGDVTWVAGYVLIAGYILGVRNERKRLKVKAVRKRRDQERREAAELFGKLTPEEQESILNSMKSLLKEKRYCDTPPVHNGGPMTPKSTQSDIGK